MNILWIFVAAVLAFLLYLVVVFNNLIRLKTRIQNALKDIEIQLKRRYELIPNLLETVKGVAKQEKELFGQVSEARSGMIKGSVSEKIAASNQLTQTLKSLFAVAESYPEMKSNASFEKLQDELIDTQDKIMAAQRFYNSMVREFDEKVQIFPTNIFAGIFGFHEKDFEYLEAPEEEKGNIKVEF